MNKEQKVALKTMAMKAKVANFIRKKLYKARLDQVSDQKKIQVYNELFPLVQEMNNNLYSYKWNRKWNAELLKTRLASPQTKTMMKKLRGKTKINLVVSE